ncbi:MAG: endonuclease/exonuclease/phosphatase family protein [Gammaproteobacteria bacterium]|nr:endonuclease/exonuclease/phosphatase family protein [Gammaproteobacteria bacterium]
MIGRLKARLRRWRRRFSRSEWAVAWLGLSRVVTTGGEPGLVLIQIDGLGHAQFEKALRAGRLPFIRRLLKRENYELKSLYAGVPSTTPAVQAELFYGAKTSLPAFSYLDPDSGKLIKLFDPDAAKTLEQKLVSEQRGLTQGGSAYGNIFGGGADESEAHFCVSALSWDTIKRTINPLAMVMLVLTNLMSIARILALLVVEVVLAVVDFVHGVRHGHDIASEAKFIFARVLVCIGLREMITIGSRIDIARGLPIIQLNLAAFDEQSHRRGPESAFAHWVLKGIDDAIRRIWLEAKRSPLRDYRVWIYSDHGQEQSISYTKLTGRHISKAVAQYAAEILGESADETATEGGDAAESDFSYRTATVPGYRRRPRAPEFANGREIERPSRTRVVAMGPVGLIYTPTPISFADKTRLAQRLVEDGQVPAALGYDDDGVLHAWVPGRELILPRDAQELIGADHPFGQFVPEDLEALCRHPGAGDLVIAGWRAGTDQPLTFARENGAHGGFGPNETHGVALLDSQAQLPARGYDHVRAADLREAALTLLEQPAAVCDVQPGERSGSLAPVTGKLELRVMTYNVHACIGMDGRCSSARIAQLIGHWRTDIVALQELDRGRPRTGGADQVREIADRLGMYHCFLPTMEADGGEYGDAILSRWPLAVERTGRLPVHRAREPRGAIWVSIDIRGLPVQVITTHLGLSKVERRLQIDELLGALWLSAAQAAGPVIFMGDLNATPRSQVWRNAAARLNDVQCALPGWRPRNTWVSSHPALRLDHIFVSEDFTVESLCRPAGVDYQHASDHLPLVADLSIDLPACSTDGEVMARSAEVERRTAEVALARAS